MHVHDILIFNFVSRARLKNATVVKCWIMQVISRSSSFILAWVTSSLHQIAKMNVIRMSYSIELRNRESSRVSSLRKEHQNCHWAQAQHSSLCLSLARHNLRSLNYIISGAIAHFFARSRWIDFFELWEMWLTTTHSDWQFFLLDAHTVWQGEKKNSFSNAGFNERSAVDGFDR
jgi:hypothetical protein